MDDRHDLTLQRWDGRERTVRATGDETVLDASESADVALPFGCRTGACGTCVGRVIDGCVTHARPPRALKSRHIEGGYVLCCIARPRDDCRIEVGADVRSQLIPNPSK